MTVLKPSGINYHALSQKLDLSKKDLKPFLQGQLDEIYAIIMEIDFAFASDREESIPSNLSDIKKICIEISADSILGYISILDNQLQRGRGNVGIIPYQTRFDNMLNAIRMSVFAYSEMINHDL